SAYSAFSSSLRPVPIHHLEHRLSYLGEEAAPRVGAKVHVAPGADSGQVQPRQAVCVPVGAGKREERGEEAAETGVGRAPAREAVGVAHRIAREQHADDCLQKRPPVAQADLDGPPDPGIHLDEDEPIAVPDHLYHAEPAEARGAQYVDQARGDRLLMQTAWLG